MQVKTPRLGLGCLFDAQAVSPQAPALSSAGHGFYFRVTQLFLSHLF